MTIEYREALAGDASRALGNQPQRKDRPMETIRDMLTVGRERANTFTGEGGWVWRIRYWDDRAGRSERVGDFPDNDLAWGVVSLILEYVERHGYDPERAIAQAMIEYREACAEWDDRTALGGAPDPASAAYQDHAHIMATYPN